MMFFALRDQEDVRDAAGSFSDPHGYQVNSSYSNRQRNKNLKSRENRFNIWLIYG